MGDDTGNAGHSCSNEEHEDFQTPEHTKLTTATGAPLVDVLLGVAGAVYLPVGVIDVYGEEATAKTTFVYSCLRQAESNGVRNALISTAVLPDKEYIESAAYKGLPVYLSETGEDALDAADVLLESGFKLIVIDSTFGIDSALSRANPLGEDSHSAANKRLLYHGLKYLMHSSRIEGATILLVSEARAVLHTKRTRSALPEICTQLLTRELHFSRKEWKTEYGEFTLGETRVRDVRTQKEASFYYAPHCGVDAGRCLVQYLVQDGGWEWRGTYLAHPAKENKLGPGYVGAAAAAMEMLYGTNKSDR